MNDLLTVHGLTHHYTVASEGLFRPSKRLKAVDGLSFHLAPGQTLGLVGESGCGKSTTAKLLMGLLQPTAGQILFDGAPLDYDEAHSRKLLRQRIQMVYQDPLSVLDKRLSALDQVVEPLTIHALGEKSLRIDQAKAVMLAVGLSPDLFNRFPHELSGGQRQRVVIARALILKPELLICDEPISALDVSIQAQVINLLSDIQQQMQLAMLFISHDLKVVRHICNHVAVMYLGKIVEQGETEQIFNHPAHPYTQALLSAIPSPRKSQIKRTRIILKGEPPDPTQVPAGCAFHPRCAVATDICRTVYPVKSTITASHTVNCHAYRARLAPIVKLVETVC